VQRLVIGRSLTRELKEYTGHLDCVVEHFAEGAEVPVTAGE
jgi:hypothetical protein